MDSNNSKVFSKLRNADFWFDHFGLKVFFSPEYEDEVKKFLSIFSSEKVNI